MVIIVREAGGDAASAIQVGEGEDAVDVRILGARDGRALVSVCAPGTTRVRGKECSEDPETGP